jgi:hypothetical protein
MAEKLWAFGTDRQGHKMAFGPLNVCFLAPRLFAECITPSCELWQALFLLQLHFQHFSFTTSSISLKNS